jgi:hypothetical protein
MDVSCLWACDNLYRHKAGVVMLRSNRRIQRHSELLRVLLLHPSESRDVLIEQRIFKHTDELTNREEKTLLHAIKERVSNGSDHS